LDNKLKTKLSFEISQIDKLINDNKPLLKLCKEKIPDYIELSATALLLHSFYNGIENILILIFKSYKEEVTGEKWHSNLLSKAFVSNANRKQIFSDELREPLEEYLKFRHFIRHAYGFQLEWLAMEDLVKRLENIWDKVKENINSIIESSP